MVAATRAWPAANDPRGRMQELAQLEAICLEFYEGRDPVKQAEAQQVAHKKEWAQPPANRYIFDALACSWRRAWRRVQRFS